ncbi:hypothetical protein BJY04DRAFT_197934 [Aspergillus karnatakaensis]|uniref:uncharacterized protein n=1 Tax=Aspergillus karnatakaensis TaxID=1810916 RepID=UPI003CCD4229
MQAIVNTGIWSQSPAHLEPNVTCSSGNCEWDEFVSLGMCSECEDITSETRFECSPHGFNNTPTSLNELAVIACYLIPPQGETFSVTVGLRYISPVYDFKALVINITEHNAWSVFTDIGLGNSADPRPNITYAGIMNPQFVIAHAELGLVQNRSTPSPISNIGRTFHIRKATQCAVGLCARTYNISVSNGTTAINVSSPHYGELFDDPESQPPPAAGSVMFWPMCWKPSDLAKVTDVQRSLNEANFTFCNIGDYSSMNSYFAGLSTVEFSLYEYPNNSFSEPTRDMRINDPPEQSVARIIRTGLESVMRDVAASFTQVGLAASNDTTQGTVFFFEVYVSVKWLWLLQPAALVLLGIVFLFLTVFTNKQQKLSLWRSSILAVLFHGLVHKEREGDVEGLSGTGKETDTADQMEKVAQGMHVRLRAVEQSRGLMLDQV